MTEHTKSTIEPSNRTRTLSSELYMVGRIIPLGKANELYERVHNCNSYEEAMQIIDQYREV